ncbi:MAG TPA: amidohydrolase family protein, partial [Thermoanaerobaculia bacterium]|nr:amidohydrolase family protein [Thermoanaerobaculia bacterium]
MKWRALFSIAAVLAAGGLAAAGPAPSVTVVRAARLIDGRGGGAVGPAMVRIEDDRIVEVGTSLPVPAGARIIDLGGATLLPGLIDLHTHLTDRFGV